MADPNDKACNIDNYSYLKRCDNNKDGNISLNVNDDSSS